MRKRKLQLNGPPLVRTYQGEEKEPAPLMLVAIGSAGCNRQSKTLSALGEEGAKRAISATWYDINVERNRPFRDFAANLPERGPAALFPEYIPTADGWHRNPSAYLRSEGSLFKDQDQIVQGISRACQGTIPQLLAEFIGPGGHSKLGTNLHRRIKERHRDAESLGAVRSTWPGSCRPLHPRPTAMAPTRGPSAGFERDGASAVCRLASNSGGSLPNVTGNHGTTTRDPGLFTLGGISDGTRKEHYPDNRRRRQPWQQRSDGAGAGPARRYRP